MSSTVMLVTAHSISDESAQEFVRDMGADAGYLVVVPANVAGGYDTFLAEDPSRAGAGRSATEGENPGQQGGLGGDPVQVDYGFAEATQASALSGSVASALETAHVAVESRTVPHHDLPDRLAQLAVSTPASAVVIATHALSPAHLMGVDLAARVGRALKSLESDISVDRRHF